MNINTNTENILKVNEHTLWEEILNCPIVYSIMIIHQEYDK